MGKKDSPRQRDTRALFGRAALPETETDRQSDNLSGRILAGHEKIIQPTASDFSPDPTPPRPAAAIQPDLPSKNTPQAKLRSPNLTNIYPEPFNRVTALERESQPHQRPVPRYDDTADHSTLLQACCITLLAAGAGALFHFWFKTAFEQLPARWAVCTQNGIATTACPKTTAITLFVDVTLFSVPAFLSFGLLRKSFMPVFYLAGFLTGMFFFLQPALARDAADFRWLYHPSLWNNWIIPMAIAGLVALAAFFGLRGAKPRRVAIVSWSIASVTAASILWLPLFVNYVLLHSFRADAQVASSRRITAIKTSDVPIYLPKDRSGALRFTAISTTIGVPGRVPGYITQYNATGPSASQTYMLLAYTYRGSYVNFSPPSTCGSGVVLIVSSSRLSAAPYPCSLFMTTPGGRKVYGYIPASRADSRLPYFEALNKDQPSTFYVPLGDFVMSFSDPVNGQDKKSPLTPAVVGDFVDSLQQLSGSDRTAFLQTYFANR